MKLYKIQQYFYPYRILDIGANAGQFHTQAKTQFPDSFIFSIEASPECEPYLKNITKNYYIGLLAKDNTKYDFYRRKGDPTCTGNSIYRELTHFYSDDQLDVVNMSGVRLDDLFEENSEFDLIKIDTQGSELDIITGGIDLCNKAKGILLEVSLTQYNENSPLYDEVINYMSNIGFIKIEILDEAHNHGSHQQDILFLNKKYLKIYDPCFGKYTIHYVCKDIQKTMKGIANIDIHTEDIPQYKGIDINNLEGSAFIIENIKGEFLIFDWNDRFGENKGIPILKNMKECLGYFNSQPSEQLNHLKTYQPHIEFKYENFNKKYINHYEKRFSTLKNAIYFSGEITDVRIKNNKFLANKEYLNHPEFVILRKIDFETYIKDIFTYRLIYSPAGGGDFTHRDIETFALGIPIIRPKYLSTTTTLQAGKHYIDIDTIDDFQSLLNNKDLLCEIGRNGRLWYEQNCLYPGNVSFIKEQIEKLLL